ncbi:hypothetical protein ES695_21330 [Candidatus Atribacteria bacterium 1244-E10-H5-B2]|nr:MAG: hypothetical protein ES695_21330 [Candidatus Atribacteria bacterium 1244-E10-H5-B2]
MDSAQISEWYESLVDDCKSIITEAVFVSRWALVEGYHQLGERVRTDLHFKEYAKGTKTSVQDLARNIGISERTLYYSMAFYDKYPSLNNVPEGKNISWNKIITRYLPESEGTKTGLNTPQYVECPRCGFEFYP